MCSVAGGADLYSVNADGAGAASIANTADNEYVQLITANGRVIFTRNAAGQDDLLSAVVDGADVRPLANSPDAETAVALTE